MRLIAKGMLDQGYWAFGRRWPRLEAIDVTVSDEEGKQILSDRNIVAIALPDVEQAKQQRRAKG